MDLNLFQLVFGFKTITNLLFTPDVDFTVFVVAASALFWITSGNQPLPVDAINPNMAIFLPSAGSVNCSALLKAGQLYVAQISAVSNYGLIIYQRADTSPGGV